MLTMLPWLISRYSLFNSSHLLKIRQGQEGPKFKFWVTTATAGSVQCQRRIYGHPAPTWLDLTDFFTLSVDMFTRPTEACQRTWPPPRLLAEKTNDLGCPRPTLSATAAATSVLLHLCHYCYFSSLLSATAACFYSTNPIGHSQCDSIETWSLTASTKVSTGTVQEPFLLLLIAVTVILLLFYFCGCYLLIITPHKTGHSYPCDLILGLPWYILIFWYNLEAGGRVWSVHKSPGGEPGQHPPAQRATMEGGVTLSHQSVPQLLNNQVLSSFLPSFKCCSVFLSKLKSVFILQ